MLTLTAAKWPALTSLVLSSVSYKRISRAAINASLSPRIGDRHFECLPFGRSTGYQHRANWSWHGDGRSINWSMSCSANTHSQFFAPALSQAADSNCQGNSASLTWWRLAFWSLTRGGDAFLRHHGSRPWIVREPNPWHASLVWFERSTCEQ